MAARQYSNIAVETTLSSGITSGASSLTVVSATGWPAAPFILVIEPDTADEELILVGAKAGAVFSTLTRGFGGTSGVAHDATDVIKHVATAEDHALLWQHDHDVANDYTAVDHDDLIGVSADDHHAQAHTIASHSDTAGTGPELDTLTDGSDAQALHIHTLPELGAIIMEMITSNQSISGITDVIFNSIVNEDDANGDVTGNAGTGAITVENTGWYLITAGVRWELNATGIRTMRIIRAGPDILAASVLVGSSVDQVQTVSWMGKLTGASGMKIEVEPSSGTLDLLFGADTFFSIAKLKA